MRATDAAFQKWALQQLRRLSKILLLEHFEPIKIEPITHNDREVYAECQFSYPYLSLTIRYSQEALKDFRDRKYQDVLDALTHEMCHALTDPLYDKAISRYVTKDEVNMERERLTDHIANIVLKARLV